MVPPASTVRRSTSGSCSGHTFDALLAPFASSECAASNWSGGEGCEALQWQRQRALAAAEARARGKARRGALLEPAMHEFDALEEGRDDGHEDGDVSVAEARLHGSRWRGASALMAERHRGSNRGRS